MTSADNEHSVGSPPDLRCFAGGYLAAQEPHIYRGYARLSAYCSGRVWRCAYCHAKVFVRKDGRMNVHKRPLQPVGGDPTE